jgi:hypothetical protein
LLGLVVIEVIEVVFGERDAGFKHPCVFESAALGQPRECNVTGIVWSTKGHRLTT